MTLSGDTNRLPTWKQEDGRRLRNNYAFRNDAQEVVRLNAQHHLFKLAWRRNFWAPLEASFAQDTQLPSGQRPLRRVLDIGCGTAIWGLEVLQQLRKAGMEVQLFNLDIDSVLIKKLLAQAWRSKQLQPHECGVLRAGGPLPNSPCFLFIQADATHQLPFSEAVFDYTHARIPDVFLSEENLPRFIQEMVRVTQPDGWVELLVADWYYTGQPSKAAETLRAVGERLACLMGLVPLGGPKFPHYLAQAGIAPPIITQLVGKTKKQQHLFLKDMLHVNRYIKQPLIKRGLMSEEVFEQTLAQFEQDALQHGLYQKLYRVFFQPSAVLRLKRQENTFYQVDIVGSEVGL